MTLMQRAEKIQVQIILRRTSENAYGSYLLELQRNYPVISAMRVLTKDGLDTNSSSLKQELKDYQSLQYYQLFDWKKE